MPSTVIQSFHYDAELRTLRVQFQSGAIYEYMDVPQTVYEQMKTYREKGVFLNQQIKGNYPFKKIS